VKNNRKHVIMANKEVIVSAGSVSSPQILMLSGIGPKEHLKSRGVCLLFIDQRSHVAHGFTNNNIIQMQAIDGSEKLQRVII
jgi:choline dehydrogenase-like flavoprotein